MKEILIRKAEKSDFPAVKKLLSTYFLDMQGIEPEAFVLAEIDGKIKGCASLIKSGSQEKFFHEIHSIAVHPNLRGKGIGTKLIKFLLTSIEDQDCNLYVRTVSPGFFEKMGFIKIEDSEKLILWEDCKVCEYFEKCMSKAMKYY